MAALRESIAFTNISNEADLIDVSDANEDGDILLSFKHKSFVIYKLSDQKPQNSWSVRHAVTLTSPVRWDHSHKRFVTVTNQHDVKLWERDLADFSRAKTKHSSTSIHEALTTLDYPEVILLYSNGHVGFLEGIKETHDQGPLKGADKILWCKAVMMATQLCVMYVAKVKDEVELYVNWYSEEENKWSKESAVIARADDKSQLCSIDSIQVKDAQNVFVLWNDGVLTRASVQNQSISVSNLPNTISGVHSNSGMVVLDTTHVAVAGCRKDKKDGIGIFDIKFGIQKTWQAFILKPHAKCKIFCVQGHLFVPCVRTLYACKYECHTSTVGSILGRNLTNKVEIPQHHSWLAIQKQGKDKQMGQDDITKQIKQLTDKSMGKDKQMCQDAITKQFKQLTDKSMNYETFKGSFVKLMKVLEDNRNQHWLSSSQMASLIQRIVGEKKFWPIKELQFLMEKQFIPVSTIETVVDSLIQHSEINMLHYLISTSNNLPEKCLCKALGFYLQCDEDEVKTVVNKIKPIEDGDETEEMDVNDEGVEGDEEENVYIPAHRPFCAHKAFLLDELMTKPFSDVFLLECLRTINFKEAQTLLEYLSYLLEKNSLFPNMNDGGDDHLTIPQVVDWLCLVIDAHMTQFVLSPYSHLTLIKLHSIVSSQVKIVSSLVNLEALLLQLKEKSVLMQDKKVGQYCIEVLHIL